MRRCLPSPAMAVACLALLVSLGGTGYAVTALPRNSVGTAQLKSNAVISAKVKNGALRAVDFAAGHLPAGAKGETGEKGDKGDRGEKGERGEQGNPGATNLIVRSVAGFKASGYHQQTISCFAGEVAAGGGASASARLLVSRPDPESGVPTGWTAAVDETGSTTLNVYAVCAAP